VSDLVVVTAGGAPFDFSSVDLYSSITPIPYVLIGYRGAAPVFTAGGTVPNTFGNFATVAADFTGIDSLVIELSNPIAVNPMGLDNMVVSPRNLEP
jgi:hypothetical protein